MSRTSQLSVVHFNRKTPLEIVLAGFFSDSNRPPTSQAFAILIKSIIFANHIVAIVSSC